MRGAATGTYINAAGEDINISHTQLATIASYVIYMFVSNSTLGPSGGNNYPNKTETNGT
jgi:hypothetical protein